MRLPRLGLVFVLALGLAFVACGGSSHSALDAGPGDGGSTGGDGALCGGFSGLRCSASEYCDYPDNGCGVVDQTGTCRTRPQVCPLSTSGVPGIAAMPTCGCDGRIYQGECDAYRGGVDLNAHGTCDVPAGSFACGYLQCFIGRQYCRQQSQNSGPDTFACLALPPACSSNEDCSCLTSQPCGTMCTGTGPGGMTLSCPPTP